MSPGLRNMEEREELRLGLVLNGGVSLAVWIGGVVHEMNRLARVSFRPEVGVYQGLAELTETAPRVDVISGASAGGLNGALLALALVNGQPLDAIRSLWLEQGSFTRLLRSPFEKNPPSLLDGDGYFLPVLEQAFERLNHKASAAYDGPIDLTVTTTLLKGRASQIWDDFGSIISDTTHRGTFRFVRGDPREPDRNDFLYPDIARCLAFAARSTASFPGAFEASFCAATEESARAARRPNMRQFTGLCEDRFMVDGGVLDNKPLGPALSAIFRQPLAHEVRRVLCYVAPDPESALGTGPDSPSERPDIADVVLASLVELPRVESISEELKDLRERNAAVLRRRHSRIALTANLSPAKIDALAETLFPVYRSRRIESSVAYIVSEISGKLAAMGTRGLGDRGRREWMTRVLSNSDLPWVPCADFPVAMTNGRTEAGWCWGTRPVEQGSLLLLDVLRRTQRLARALRARPPQLVRAWNSTFCVLEDLEQLREMDRAYWRAHASSLKEALGTGAGDKSIAELSTAVRDWSVKVVSNWLGANVQRMHIGPKHGRDAAAVLGMTIARELLQVAGVVEELVDVTLRSGDALLKDSAEQLRKHMAFFVRSSADSPEAILQRLLELEIITLVTGEQSDVLDQVVEIAQISAQDASPLGGPRTLASKLAGLQLAHFGGFYKTSWRANDWMFGRMDGAARLVSILLNPERLRVVLQGQADPVGHALQAIERVAFGGLPEKTRRYLENHFDRELAKRELAYLADQNLPTAESLKECTRALVCRLHFEILCEELKTICDACEEDALAGAATRAAGVAFAKRFRGSVPGASSCADIPPEQVVALFEACTIGSEKLSGEAGSDLFTAMACRTLAVGVSAGQGNASGLGPLRPVLRVVRAPAIAAYLVASSLTWNSRFSSAALGAAASFALVVLGLSVTGGFSGSPMLVSGAQAVLAALVFVLLIRTPRLVAWIGAAAIAVLIFVLARYGVPLPDWPVSHWQKATFILALLASLLGASYLFDFGTRRVRYRSARAALPGHSMTSNEDSKERPLPGNRG